MSGWRRDVAAVKVAARDTEAVHATRTSSGRRACRDGGIRIRRRGQPGRRQGAGAGAVRRHHRDRPRHRQDRKSTRLNSVTNAHLVCRLLLEKKKIYHKIHYTVLAHILYSITYSIYRIY